MSGDNQVQVVRTQEPTPDGYNVLNKSLCMNFLRKKLKTLEMTEVRTMETSNNSNSSNNSEAEFYPSRSFPSIDVSQNSSGTRSSASRKNTSFSKKFMGKLKQKKRENTHTIIAKNILNAIPTVYTCEINCFTSNHEVLQEAIAKLYRSEKHVLAIIKKYILDEQFKEILLEASSVYFSLQNNAKYQALTSANDDLLSQIEADKCHREILQENLDFLLQQNRSLQEEIESVYRNCEHLSIKLLSRTKHQQAIGSILMKNIVSNNKNLHGKVKAMTEIIQVIESKMAKMQRHVRKIESDKRNVKKDLVKVLESSEILIGEHELQNAVTKRQLETQLEKLEAVSNACNILLEELVTYERQIKNMPFSLNWPQLMLETDEPLEIIHKCKSCVEELVRALITTNTNATILARDATRLRELTARLQENQRKSTDELDNISKQNEKSSTAFIDDANNFEAAKEKTENLIAELEQTKVALGEANASIEAMTLEHSCLRGQIENLLGRMSCSGASNFACGDAACKLKSSREKLEYLYEDYIQMATDKKCLSDKCKNLEDANHYLHADLETCHHQLEVAREDFETVSVENDYLKKQLESDHKTICSLQNERVKYLEEKSILKTIFQHLKVEIVRVQELEGALADMSKETSRLSLIAKYNKELGDKLKSEVDLKESTIRRLKENIEEISNIHFDSENDLCAQLSEMENVKDQLSEFLEKELEKGMELDETKKRLEDTTNQKQLFEEIQRHERLALKGLLKNFKNIVKQRDVLLQHLEEMNRENTQLKLEYKEQPVTTSDLQYDEMAGNMKIKDDTIKHLEKKNKNDMLRYQKKVRHLEKHLQKLRKTKDELEKSNEYLKKNAQKLHGDLNEALKKENEALQIFTLKEIEKSSLESELERCRTELEGLRQVNKQVAFEYSENYCIPSTEGGGECNNDNNTETLKEIQELKVKIRDRDEQIAKLQGEFQCVNKQIEDQEQIMVHYENEIFRLSTLEQSMTKKYDDELEELRMYKKHQEMSESRQDKEISNSTFSERSVQAERPFQEQDNNNCGRTEMLTIGNMTMPVCEVIEALQNEKLRYVELSELHEKLKWECKDKDEAYVSEMKLHRETLQRFADMQDCLKTIELERDDLANKIETILTDEDDNKAKCIELCNENANLNNILEEAKQRYMLLVGRQLMLEAELKHQFDLKELFDEDAEELIAQLKQSEITIEELKKDLGSSQTSLYHFKEKYYKLQQQVTGLEFKICEVTLELHETQGKLETEQRLNSELKQERKVRNSSTDESSS